MTTTLASRDFLGMRVDATSYPDAVARIVDWATAGASRAVYVATVNNVMEAYDDPAYRDVMNSGDLVTPDGVPLVWGLRLLGIRRQARVYGPALTPSVCEAAARAGIPVGFYGGAPEVLDRLVRMLAERYPGLDVAYQMSPPFRPLRADEEGAIVDAINASGARILFVGLGAPKQERWIAAHVGTVDAVMLGVGAAFDLITGAKRTAPALMQRLGLEWLFRLTQEPRRLWRRYAVHNPRFIMLFGRQVVAERRAGKR